MGRVAACTVITRNRLAHARVLAESFLAHHPDGRIAVLLLDSPDGPSDGEPFEVVQPSELALERDELARMARSYDAFELSCALKPWIVELLLAGGEDAVLYLDSDVEVFAPLAEAARLAVERGLVLTPQHAVPPPQGPDFERERILLRGGAFNGGFVGVGSAGEPFLRWWQERLARDCRDSLDEGLFVDQRWLDLAPVYFDAAIVRDPGWNVAPWNLLTRRVTRDGDAYLVDGRLLRFFHFSGFDPERPYLLSRWLLPVPEILLSEHPPLRDLCANYAARLRDHGWEEVRDLPYDPGSVAGEE